MLFAGEGNRPSVDADLNNFQPRLGFAYQLDEYSSDAVGMPSTRCRRSST